MNCPVCHEPMKKIGWYLTNNGKVGQEFKEYGKTMYQCKTNDTWLTTELPAKP